MRKTKSARSLYLSEVFSKEDALLFQIRQAALEEGVEHMQISAYEGRILQFLCQALQVSKVVEIGTLYGYSSLMMARVLPEKGKLFTLDLSMERQEKAKRLIQSDPSAKKIQFISGSAMDSLSRLETLGEGPFDMVFIDADKSSYLNYLHWSNRNLKSGGLLVADNTFLFGAVYGELMEGRNKDDTALQVMKQFNQEVANQDVYISTLIPTAEGLTVGIKK